MVGKRVYAQYHTLDANSRTVERRMSMAICRQACPYNTLNGCKVKEYGGVCQLTNTSQPITEYRMTNADRIRNMTDEELKKFICSMFKCEFCDFELGERCGLLNWLQMPAEVIE